MNTGSATIGAIITIICVLPFLFMYMSKTKKKKTALQTLQQLASKHDCKISQYDFLDHMVIGIDTDKKCLFFTKKENDKNTNQFIDLQTVSMCYPNKALRTIIVSDKKKNSVIERVELCFESKTNNVLPTTFELYNEKDDVQLRTEILLSDKWANLINAQLA